MTYLEQWKVARCLACQCDVIAMSVIASEGAEQRQMKSDLSKAVLNSSLIVWLFLFFLSLGGRFVTTMLYLHLK